MSIVQAGYVPSPRRIAVIASTTFVQLVRMKVFVFMIAFALIALAVSLIPSTDVLGPETKGENELILLKSSLYSVMRLFGLIFSVAAMALIIPKDVEDRILYTILCKPVPRIDYLLGKTVGVLALAFMAMIVMDLMMTGVLWYRSSELAQLLSENLSNSRYSAEEVQFYVNKIINQGPTWNLQIGVGICMMEIIVLTSLTLLISCFTSGTILSALLALMVYVIGLFHNQAVSIWSSGDWSGGIQTWVTKIGSVIFPNFSLYGVIDSAINGIQIPMNIFFNLIIITIAYFAFHVTLSAWLFRKKEF